MNPPAAKRNSDNSSMKLTPELFQPEVEHAVAAYEKYIVCIEKTPEEFLKSLQSLLRKAIQAYEARAPGLRHGIALDAHITIMISQNDHGPRPLCGIYFNLHSPFRKRHC